MNHRGTVRLETERLVLRQISIEDVEPAFRNWMSDEKVTEFLRWPTHKDISISERVIKEWIGEYQKNKAFYQWTIVLKELGEPIGSISVVGMNEKIDMVHIGYCIGSKWWGNGYMSEAFARIIPFLFDEVGAQRIEAQHDPNNPASGKVMEKCGLKYEGTLRKADWSNKGIVDAAMYGLIRGEHRRNREGKDND